MKQIWIYDIEQYRNFHCCTFQTKDGTDTRQFVLHNTRNDIDSYMHFLETEVDGFIGFNNLNYDGVVLNYLYNLVRTYDYITLETLLEKLYYISNAIVYDEQTDLIKELRKNRKWVELDLFKIHHFDNKAKKTSLKAVGIAIKHSNIQDLPIPADQYIQESDISLILEYNLNDVVITSKLFKETESEIRMRIQFGEKYGLDIINANDPQIGSKLIAKYISRALNMNYYTLSQLRTYRKEIKLNDIILPYISFQTKEFNSILTHFKDTIVTQTKDAFEDLSIIINETKYVFGTGGIHGAKRAGIYTIQEDEKIILVDVSSFYPNIAIKNRFYPQHLTDRFCDIYNNIYQERLKAKKENLKAIDKGLKLALNSTFGKSNDIYSFLYDPAFTMKITINGQLLLAMLTESFILSNIEIIQVNTDGVMIRCKNTDEERVKEICKQWEELTKLSLDFDYFKKIIMRDVNNYIGVYLVPGKEKETKQKGVFLVDRELYKDHSMKVVRKAVHDYFTYDIPIEQTIKTHTDIYDFCIRYKSTGDWKPEAHYLDGQRERIDELNKNVRFFISKNGASLYKRHKTDNRLIGIQVGKCITVFNQYFERPMNEYNIDYEFYIKEAYDIVFSVYDGQLTLF